MANNSTGTSTNMSSTVKTVKKVVKKETTPEVAAPIPVAAAPVKEVKAKKEKTSTTTTAATITPVPVAASVVAPEASAVEAAATGPTTTVQQDIDSLVAQFQTVRDAAVNGLKALQKLSKRVAREVKEAGRRRRRQRKTEGSEGEASKRPTIFKTPVTLKKELCSFFGKTDGTQMTPADVTKAFSAYVESHKLKNAEKGQGHTIHPDAAMRKLFGLKDGETVSYRNVQAHLYKLYILPEKKSAIAASS